MTGSEYHHKQAIICLPAKFHLNGVSVWRFVVNECWLGSFVGFQGIRTHIDKKTQYFSGFFFQWGKGVGDLGPPSGFAHVKVKLSIVYY